VIPQLLRVALPALTRCTQIVGDAQADAELMAAIGAKLEPRPGTRLYAATQPRRTRTHALHS